MYVEFFNANDGSCDVDDGVDGADFMELDAVDGCVMDFAFCCCEFFEDGDAGFFYVSIECAVLYDGGDVFEGSVVMVFFVDGDVYVGGGDLVFCYLFYSNFVS